MSKKKTKNTYSVNFTDSQVAEVVAWRDDGLSWPEIAEMLNEEWSLEASPKVYEGLERRFGDKVREPKKPHPMAFFTKEAMGRMPKTNDKQKDLFFITGVGAAAPLHLNAFSAMRNMCRRTGAEMILQPIPAHVRALASQPNHFDPILQAYQDFFATEYTFNENLKAVELHINPQRPNPLTGIARIRGKTPQDEMSLIKASKKSSIIVAHTKQMMESKSTGVNSTPRIIHSTGSITMPAYLPNQPGTIAEEDHVLGGLILEIHKEKFFLTQVQFHPTTGSFVDKYGNRYHADGKMTKERCKAFVVGDSHPDYYDKDVNDTLKEIWAVIQPEKILLNDWFGSTSISHHLKDKIVDKNSLPEHLRTLQNEIDHSRKVLYDLADGAPVDAKIYTVASNHPEHCLQYLNRGGYLKDCKENYWLGHRMIVDLENGIDPLLSRIDPDNRFIHLSRKDSLVVEGAEVGQHGDLGANGSRGSIKQDDVIYGSSMAGHCHGPCIVNSAFRVGHGSGEDHGYNRGPGSWLICHGVVWEFGHKQLIICIDNEWKKPA